MRHRRESFEREAGLRPSMQTPPTPQGKYYRNSKTGLLVRRNENSNDRRLAIEKNNEVKNLTESDQHNRQSASRQSLYEQYLYTIGNTRDINVSPCIRASSPKCSLQQTASTPFTYNDTSEGNDDVFTDNSVQAGRNINTDPNSFVRNFFSCSSDPSISPVHIDGSEPGSNQTQFSSSSQESVVSSAKNLSQNSNTFGYNSSRNSNTFDYTKNTDVLELTCNNQTENLSFEGQSIDEGFNARQEKAAREKPTTQIDVTIHSIPVIGNQIQSLRESTSVIHEHPDTFSHCSLPNRYTDQQSMEHYNMGFNTPSSCFLPDYGHFVTNWSPCNSRSVISIVPQQFDSSTPAFLPKSLQKHALPDGNNNVHQTVVNSCAPVSSGLLKDMTGNVSSESAIGTCSDSVQAICSSRMVQIEVQNVSDSYNCKQHVKALSTGAASRRNSATTSSGDQCIKTFKSTIKKNSSSLHNLNSGLQNLSPSRSRDDQRPALPGFAETFRKDNLNQSQIRSVSSNSTMDTVSMSLANSPPKSDRHACKVTNVCNLKQNAVRAEQLVLKSPYNRKKLVCMNNEKMLQAKPVAECRANKTYGLKSLFYRPWETGEHSSTEKTKNRIDDTELQEVTEEISKRNAGYKNRWTISQTSVTHPKSVPKGRQTISSSTFSGSSNSFQTLVVEVNNKSKIDDNNSYNVKAIDLDKDNTIRKRYESKRSRDKTSNEATKIIKRIQNGRNVTRNRNHCSTFVSDMAEIVECSLRQDNTESINERCTETRPSFNAIHKKDSNKNKLKHSKHLKKFQIPQNRPFSGLFGTMPRSDSYVKKLEDLERKHVYFLSYRTKCLRPTIATVSSALSHVANPVINTAFSSLSQVARPTLSLNVDTENKLLKQYEQNVRSKLPGTVCLKTGRSIDNKLPVSQQIHMEIGSVSTARSIKKNNQTSRYTPYKASSCLAPTREVGKRPSENFMQKQTTTIDVNDQNEDLSSVDNQRPKNVNGSNSSTNFGPVARKSTKGQYQKYWHKNLTLEDSQVALPDKHYRTKECVDGGKDNRRKECVDGGKHNRTKKCVDCGKHNRTKECVDCCKHNRTKECVDGGKHNRTKECVDGGGLSTHTGSRGTEMYKKCKYFKRIKDSSADSVADSVLSNRPDMAMRLFNKEPNSHERETLKVQVNDKLTPRTDTEIETKQFTSIYSREIYSLSSATNSSISPTELNENRLSSKDKYENTYHLPNQHMHLRNTVAGSLQEKNKLGVNVLHKEQKNMESMEDSDSSENTTNGRNSSVEIISCHGIGNVSRNSDVMEKCVPGHARSNNSKHVANKTSDCLASGFAAESLCQPQKMETVSGSLKEGHGNKNCNVETTSVTSMQGGWCLNCVRSVLDNKVDNDFTTKNRTSSEISTDKIVQTHNDNVISECCINNDFTQNEGSGVERADLNQNDVNCSTPVSRIGNYAEFYKSVPEDHFEKMQAVENVLFTRRTDVLDVCNRYKEDQSVTRTCDVLSAQSVALPSLVSPSITTFAQPKSCSVSYSSVLGSFPFQNTFENFTCGSEKLGSKCSGNGNSYDCVNQTNLDESCVCRSCTSNKTNSEMPDDFGICFDKTFSSDDKLIATPLGDVKTMEEENVVKKKSGLDIETKLLPENNPTVINISELEDMDKYSNESSQGYSNVLDDAIAEMIDDRSFTFPEQQVNVDVTGRNTAGNCPVPDNHSAASTPKDKALCGSGLNCINENDAPHTAYQSRIRSERTKRFQKKFPYPMPRAKPNKNVGTDEILYKDAGEFLADFDVSQKRSCRKNKVQHIQKMEDKKIVGKHSETCVESHSEAKTAGIQKPDIGNAHCVNDVTDQIKDCLRSHDKHAADGTVCNNQVQRADSLKKVEILVEKKRKGGDDNSKPIKKKIKTGKLDSSDVSRQKFVSPKKNDSKTVEVKVNNLNKKKKVNNIEKKKDKKLVSKTSAKQHSKTVSVKKQKGAGSKKIKTEVSDEEKKIPLLRIKNEKSGLKIIKGKKETPKLKKQQMKNRFNVVNKRLQVQVKEIKKENNYMDYQDTADNVKFKCPACSQTFPTDMLVKRHCILQHKEWCALCKIKFPDTETRFKHVKRGHNIRMYCKVCEIWYSSISSYKKHLNCKSHIQNDDRTVRDKPVYKNSKKKPAHKVTSKTEPLDESEDYCSTARHCGTSELETDQAECKTRGTETSVSKKKRVRAAKYCIKCKRSYRWFSVHIKTEKHLKGPEEKHITQKDAKLIKKKRGRPKKGERFRARVAPVMRKDASIKERVNTYLTIVEKQCSPEKQNPVIELTYPQSTEKLESNMTCNPVLLIKNIASSLPKPQILNRQYKSEHWDGHDDDDIIIIENSDEPSEENIEKPRKVNVKHYLKKESRGQSTSNNEDQKYSDQVVIVSSDSEM